MSRVCQQLWGGERGRFAHVVKRGLWATCADMRKSGEIEFQGAYVDPGRERERETVPPLHTKAYEGRECSPAKVRSPTFEEHLRVFRRQRPS